MRLLHNTACRSDLKLVADLSIFGNDPKIEDKNVQKIKKEEN